MRDLVLSFSEGEHGRRSGLDPSCNDVPSKKIKLDYDQEDGCTPRGCEDIDIKSKQKKKHKHKRQQIKDNVQTIETSADAESSSDKLSKKKKHKFHYHVVLDHHHKTHNLIKSRQRTRGWCNFLYVYSRLCCRGGMVKRGT